MQEELDIKHHAYLSINYILHIFSSLQVTEIKCVATAVLRDHPRSKVFIEFIKEKFTIPLKLFQMKRKPI